MEGIQTIQITWYLLNNPSKKDKPFLVYAITQLSVKTMMMFGLLINNMLYLFTT